MLGRYDTVYRNKKRSWDVHSRALPVRHHLFSDFFPTPLKSSVKEVSSGWEYVTPGCEDINQAPISNLECWETEHTRGFTGHFILCSWRWRGRLKQTNNQNDLGFHWMWKRILTYVLSISHSLWDTTMPTTEAQEVKNSFCLYGIVQYVCINWLPG